MDAHSQPTPSTVGRRAHDRSELVARACAARRRPRGDPGRASTFIEPVEPLPVVVPPANDEFAAAEVIVKSPFATFTSTLEATTAPDDPSCFGNDASVWYAYTPPVSTMITADTFGSDYDTTLSVYTGAQGLSSSSPATTTPDPASNPRSGFR